MFCCWQPEFTNLPVYVYVRGMGKQMFKYSKQLDKHEESALYHIINTFKTALLRADTFAHTCTSITRRLRADVAQVKWGVEDERGRRRREERGRRSEIMA